MVFPIFLQDPPVQPVGLFSKPLFPMTGFLQVPQPVGRLTRTELDPLSASSSDALSSFAGIGRVLIY
jgi:hypothetical protein